MPSKQASRQLKLLSSIYKALWQLMQQEVCGAAG
jgi:hypothetical protein